MSPPTSNIEIPRAKPTVTRSKKRRTINEHLSQFSDNSLPCNYLYHSKLVRSRGTNAPGVPTPIPVVLQGIPEPELDAT